jgi:hypothetical protein
LPEVPPEAPPAVPAVLAPLPAVCPEGGSLVAVEVDADGGVAAGGTIVELAAGGGLAAGAAAVAPLGVPLLPTAVALPGATSTSTIRRISPELGSITISRRTLGLTAEIFTLRSSVRSTLSTS